MGQVVGVDAAVQVGELVAQQWAFLVMQLSGFAGLLLALPLATAAVWRAGMMPWWPTAAVVMGEVAFVGFGVTLPGNLILTGCLAVVAFAIARTNRTAWTVLDVPAESAPATR